RQQRRLEALLPVADALPIPAPARLDTERARHQIPRLQRAPAAIRRHRIKTQDFERAFPAAARERVWSPGEIPAIDQPVKVCVEQLAPRGIRETLRNGEVGFEVNEQL